MNVTNAFLAAAISLAACTSSSHPGADFSEWLGYELGSTFPPPASYVLIGDEESCRIWPLSDCIYSHGSLRLDYYNGILLSKTAFTEGLTHSNPLIDNLATAGSEEKVLNILREYSQHEEPVCSDVGESYRPCGYFLSYVPSEHFEASFSENWDLLSIRFSKQDEL
jgi:hypothetical protein